MKYKVGDVVRIREWDDMENEFGLDDDGAIKCPGDFVRSMKEFCGREGTICDYHDNYYRIVFDGEEESWNFSDAMIDHKYAQEGVTVFDFTDCVVRGVERKMPGIKKVIFNNPATIVFWNDV